MDRELKKWLHWLVIVALIIALANMLGGCVRVREVRITDTVSYVPRLLLPPEDTVLGRMKCDLNGKSGKYFHPNLAPSQVVWVDVHEQVHVEQTQRYGGCNLFVNRYQTDKKFRLEMEAEAYCKVFKLQTLIGAPGYPDPKYLDILAILINKYDGNWSDAEVKDAMNCKPP